MRDCSGNITDGAAEQCSHLAWRGSCGSRRTASESQDQAVPLLQQLSCRMEVLGGSSRPAVCPCCAVEGSSMAQLRPAGDSLCRLLRPCAAVTMRALFVKNTKTCRFHDNRRCARASGSLPDLQNTNVCASRRGSLWPIAASKQPACAANVPTGRKVSPDPTLQKVKHS